jgi:CDP-diacylglycerol--glycerol-3-phosphate 3-phosphatidyltransferase
MTSLAIGARRVFSPARLPDLVILTRVALAFAVLGLFSLPFPYPAAGLVLIVVAIAMDGLDGYLARRLGVTSDLGAILDITGDRIVEHVFWIYFAVAGLVPIWVPLLIVSRSFTVDAVRSVALSAGKTAFGEKTMQRSSVSRFLVASRTMRGAYGVAKVASFVLLGLLGVLSGAADEGVALISAGASAGTLRLTDWVVGLTVLICLVRALPVIWDARVFFSHRPPDVP